MKKILLTVGLILIFALSLNAQGGGSVGVSNPIAAGMGNTYITTSRGVYSIHRNPANLTLSPNNEFQLATVLPLPTMNAFAGTDFMSISEYNYFFGGVDQNGTTVGRTLTNEDKDRLRNLFADGGQIQEDFSVTYLAFSYKISDDIGSIAFSIDGTESASFLVPQAFVDLALEGNPVGKVYDFSGMKIGGSWMRYYSLSYARDFADLTDGLFTTLSAGVSFKLVHGYAYAGTDHMNSTFETLDDQNKIRVTGDALINTAISPSFGSVYDFDSTDAEQSLGPFPEPAGSGFGFDIGFTARFDDVFTFGLAFTDIGSITWNKNTAAFSSSATKVIDDVTDKAQLDSLADAFSGKGEYTDAFTSKLPTAFRFGVSARVDKMIEDFPGRLAAALDYNQGFNDEPRNSTKPRVSLGFEWRPFDIWPIRTGFTFGGIFGTGWSFGTGIDTGVFEFNFGFERFSDFMRANDAQRIQMAIGSRWRF